MTEQAYFWLRKNGIGRGARVWGTKGSARPLAGKIHVGKPFDRIPSAKTLAGGLQIILLDTSELKEDDMDERLVKSKCPYQVVNKLALSAADACICKTTVTPKG